MEITWRVISGEGRGENEEKVQGVRSINGRYKIDRGMLRTVQEMEKPKNFHACLCPYLLFLQEHLSYCIRAPLTNLILRY